MPDTPPSDEITAEFDTGALAAASGDGSAPTVRAHVRWAARTDIGRVREHNEDKYDGFQPDDGAVLARRGEAWAVADGMGGHAAGQRASERGLRAFLDAYLAPDGPAGVADALRFAAERANAEVCRLAAEDARLHGMGSTLVALALRGDVATVAWVGDSRALLFRCGEPPALLTRDHSWVEEQVRAGEMTPDEAARSTRRNVITRCLGLADHPGADIEAVRVREGDVFALISDGVSNHVDAEGMARRIEGRGLCEAARDIVDDALAAGGTDNATVLLVRIESLRQVG